MPPGVKPRLPGLLLAAFLLLPLSPVWATSSPSQAAAHGTLVAAVDGSAEDKVEAPPPQVRALLELLRDPAIGHWLANQKTGSGPAPADAERLVEEMEGPAALSHLLERISRAAHDLMMAAPRLPDELDLAVNNLYYDLTEKGLWGVLVTLFGFLALGVGLERLVIARTAGIRAKLASAPLDTVEDRLSAAGGRLIFGLCVIIAFTIGSIGGFLLFPWPPLLRHIVLGYLMVVVIFRITHVLGRFLLSPPSRAFVNWERFRTLSMSDEASLFWYRRTLIIVSWTAFCWVTINILRTLGVSVTGGRLIAAGMELALLAMALEAIFNRPLSERVGLGAATLTSWTLAVWSSWLWFAWIAGMRQLFWISLFAVAIPLIVRFAQRWVAALLRPAGEEGSLDPRHSLRVVILERGLRLSIIVLASALLLRVLEVDMMALGEIHSPLANLFRGAINALLIILVADFLWGVARAYIDCRLVREQALTGDDQDEKRRRARIRTLLPIARNLLFAVLATMAVLMALSALGVDVAPLVAGAGVVGVAVGFGAQTLVHDIISGIFYLLDDAFRVGEYIQTGHYKGNVESFSLRSIKLRHHRGALFTIPFGQLGAIENNSRDWVIDKISINVTHDADLDLAKKLTKQVGRELQADPELGPHIMEPLKMQGVEAFGDFATQLRFKFKTKPGEQFVIRRLAFAKLKAVFEENGIKLAVPTVRMAGGMGDENGGGEDAVIAQQAMAMLAPKAADAPPDTR